MLSSDPVPWLLSRHRGLCRCSAEDISAIIRDPDGPGKGLPEYGTSTELAHPEESHRQGMLHSALLQHPQNLADKYHVEGTETMGHKAARRNEHLLQLFLYLHVLAAGEPGSASVSRSKQRSCARAASGPPETARRALTTLRAQNTRQQQVHSQQP